MQVAKKVAVNSIVQYVKLVLNLIIALFSVRIILNALGTIDYGVYDVIAGVVAILGFVQSSFTQTSVRYLSVSLGKKDINEVRKTFSNTFWLQLFTAICLFLLLEFVGLFIFEGFLNIPVERITSARYVFHCMTLTLFLHVAVTPFHSIIISHENFLYTSCISVLDSLLKLGIAYFLMFYSGDKLIVYGILMTLVTLFNVSLHVIYVKIKYRMEVYFGIPSIIGLKSQTSFAGWTLIDVISRIANRQGYAVMLNKFFGPTMNTVYALSRQVEGQMYNLSVAVVDTMKPQIMKSYGANDKERMFRLSITAGKFGFLLMSFVAIPLLIMMPQVLQFWLKTVPEGTVLFTRLMIVACMSEQLTKGVVHACQATGNIKWFSIIVSSVRFLALPISVFLLILGMPAYIAIVVFLLCEVAGSLARVFVISKLENFDVCVFFKDVLLRIIPPFFLSFILCYFINLNYNSFVCIIYNVIITSVVYALIVYNWGLTGMEKNTVNNLIKTTFERHEK